MIQVRKVLIVSMVLDSLLEDSGRLIYSRYKYGEVGNNKNEHSTARKLKMCAHVKPHQTDSNGATSCTVIRPVLPRSIQEDHHAHDPEDNETNLHNHRPTHLRQRDKEKIW